jgi:hypothetical protein
MDKKKSTFKSFSIDHPLIELVDVQVPCDTVDEGKSKPEAFAKNGKTRPRLTKKKSTKRRKN